MDTEGSGSADGKRHRGHRAVAVGLDSQEDETDRPQGEEPPRVVREEAEVERDLRLFAKSFRRVAGKRARVSRRHS